jgi:hypothetical protein
VLRKVGGGVLAALIAGVVLGVVARGLMSLVTLAAGGTPSFSVSGSAFVLLIYAAAMVPGGAVAGATVRRRRWVLPVAGALFLCFPAVGVAAEEVGSTDGFGAAQWLGVGAAGAAVFGTIALLPLVTVRLADAFAGRPRGSLAAAGPAAA